MQTYVLIPARSGSKGVPDKNIKELNGKPLIAYTIETAKQLKSIDSIMVTTDSEEYIKIANKYGAGGIIRPDHCSSNTSGDIDYLLHAIYTMNMMYDDIIVLLRPTTPLRDSKVIDGAWLSFMGDSMLFDSLRSMHKMPEPPEKLYKIENGIFAKPYMDIDIELSNQPRQAFDDCYKPNGYADIIKVSSILNTKTTYGNMVRAFKTPPVIEVDTQEEFDLLELIMEKKNESI